MANKSILTDEQVEAEIARLTKSEAVRVARAEQRMKYRRRQYLYHLRDLEKRGRALIEAGTTPDTIGDYIDDGEVYYDAP